MNAAVRSLASHRDDKAIDESLALLGMTDLLHVVGDVEMDASAEVLRFAQDDKSVAHHDKSVAQDDKSVAQDDKA